MEVGLMDVELMKVGSIRVFHGVRLEELTSALAETLYPFPEDPFTPELMVIPNIGIGDWVQREVPEALGRLVSVATGRQAPGVLANFHLLTTHAFTNLIVNGNQREFDSRWSRSRLLWFVHRAIDKVGRDSVPGAVDNRLHAADAIADLFDRYATHRPSMLQYWREGRPTDGVDPLVELPESMRWQTAVYREVCSMIDSDSMMQALGHLRTNLSAGDVPVHIPHRVSVFGFSTLNPTLRILLEVLATRLAVNVFMLHPIAGPWESTEESNRDRLVARSQVSSNVLLHPLVARWGRMALESRELVGDASVHEIVSAPLKSSLLGRLQTELITSQSADLVSLESAAGIEALQHGDGTIQVHACYGRARQVEALRDALLHCLNNDPTLRLDEILIVCPEIEDFASIIPAIFRSEESTPDGVVKPSVTTSHSSPPLEVRLAELDMAEDAPVIDAFLAIVGLVSTRCGVADVLGLLSRSVVMRRFNLDEGSVGRLMELAENLGVSFGINSQQRAAWNVPADIQQGTWHFALTRLMMGLAVAAPHPLVGPGEVVPYDDLSVTEAPMLGAMAEYLARLAEFLEFAEQSHTVIQWLDSLSSIVDDMTASHDPDSGRTELLAVLDEIEMHITDAALDRSELFSLDEMIFVVQGHLGRRPRRPLFRTGAITVTRVPPVQGVPYRIVALLGADEGIFSAGGTSGDDVLMLKPCLGEPNLAAGGRMAFLNLMLAARDAFIITCDGADLNSNKPIPLAVPVQELLEASAALVDPAQPGEYRLLASHPRQNFHPSTMQDGLVLTRGPFTFDQGSLRALEQKLLVQSADHGPVNEDVQHRAVGEDPGERNRIDIESLIGATTDPIRWFARSVANVKIESVSNFAASEVVEVKANALFVSQESRLLFEHLRQSPEFQSGNDLRDVVQQWRVAMLKSGLFPPGRLGEEEIDDIYEEVSAFLRTLPAEYFDSSKYRSVDIDINVEELPSDGCELAVDGGLYPQWISGSIENIAGTDLIRVKYRRPKESLYLGPALELALLALSEPEIPYRALVVFRDPDKSGVIAPIAIRVNGGDAEQRQAQAIRFVTMAVEMWRCAGQGLLPVFPVASTDLGRGRTKKARDAFDKERVSSAEISYFFGDMSWDDIISEPVQPFDPPGKSILRARRYAEYLWQTFDDTMRIENEVIDEVSATFVGSHQSIVVDEDQT